MTEQETPNLNRQQRRALEKLQGSDIGKKLKKPNLGPRRDYVLLRSIDELIDEDGDISFYSIEEDYHKQSLRQLTLARRFHLIIKSTGATDDTLRYYAVHSGEEGYNHLDFFTKLAREVNIRKLHSNYAALQSLVNQMSKGKRFIPDDVEVWSELVRDKDIPLIDLYNEAIRSRKETLELIQLQIEWLNEHETSEITDSGYLDREEETPDTEYVVATPFSLSDWNLSLTTRNWSSDSHHLIKIPTGSREEALEHIKSNLKGEIMIKPGSVLRALEFFLNKNVLQRAMASRLKYVPEHMRDWIKIKRGRDRILLLVPEEGQGIFFAGNRDEIYRRI